MQEQESNKIHEHDHKNCGHSNQSQNDDIILETKLISQNLSLTYSPITEERMKARDFMTHFFKRQDAVKVLLQVIVITKEYKVKKVAAIHIQDFLTRSIKFEIDYCKEDLAFIEGLILSTVSDFNIMIKIEEILLDCLQEIYGAKKCKFPLN